MGVKNFEGSQNFGVQNLLTMGAEQRVKCAQTRERGPPSAPAEIYLIFVIFINYVFHNCIRQGRNL